MTKKEIDIIVDSREEFSDFFVSKLSEMGLSCRIEKLPAGDFLLFAPEENKSILVERKTASDFLSSIEGKMDKKTRVWIKGRIWDQAKRMVETGLKPYLLIEGNIYSKRNTVYRKKGFEKRRIWGALDGIRSYGISIHFVKNKEETVEWLKYLSDRLGRPKKPFTLRASAPNQLSMEEKQEYLLEGFPSIGPMTAKSILGQYGSLKNALEHLEEWGNIRGIGQKTVRDCLDVWRYNRKRSK